jgi:hypothetical protein
LNTLLETIDHILTHHGVKGMKWGVRRDRTPRSVTVTQKGKKLKAVGGKNQPAHPDAVRVKTIGQIRKKSGAQALSNQDLEAFNKRLNLEASAQRLDYGQKSRARKFVASLLGTTGKNSAQAVANEASSRAVKRILVKGAAVAAVAA